MSSEEIRKLFQNRCRTAQKNVFPFFSFRLPTDSRMGADNTWWWGAAKNNSHSSSLLCRFIHSALLFFVYWLKALASDLPEHINIAESAVCLVHANTNKILNRLRSAEDSQEHMSQFSMSNHSRMWSVHDTLIATVSTFLFFSRASHRRLINTNKS